MTNKIELLDRLLDEAREEIQILKGQIDQAYEMGILDGKIKAYAEMRKDFETKFRAQIKQDEDKS